MLTLTPNPHSHSHPHTQISPSPSQVVASIEEQYQAMGLKFMLEPDSGLSGGSQQPMIVMQGWCSPPFQGMSRCWPPTQCNYNFHHRL